ncbi:MAG: hypothetical protein RLZZ106_999, partial [Cyanobacteriota bacterium]
PSTTCSDVGSAIAVGIKTSGRYWNRTSDSYRVKVVLYL